MIRRALVLLAVLAAVPVPAATIAVTPATFAATIATAAPGGAVRLGPGTYPFAYFRGATLPRGALTITADPAAVSAGMRFDGASGVTVSGVAFDGGGTVAAGLQFAGGSHDAATLNRFTGFVRAGIELGPDTDDSRVAGNLIARSGSDGIDVAASHRVAVDRNTCMDALPTPGAHPDCVQLWSIAGHVPTADVAVTDTVAIGAMQGVSLFDHVVAGVDQGGFDRVAITGTIAVLSYPDAISVYACRACTIGGAGPLANTVRTIAGSPYVAKIYADPASASGLLANDVGSK